MNLLNEAKYRFNVANPITRLIYINGAIFVSLVLIQLFLWMFQTSSQAVLSLMALPAGLNDLLLKPWTIITYQFTHMGLFHFIFNMMFLYVGGNIFMDFFRKKDVWKVYIWGGVSAAALFIVSSYLIPAMSNRGGATLHGASGSVMAILLAATIYAPNIILNVFGIFPVKLKWITTFFILVDLINIPLSNSGGHIAHIGGALFGCFFALHQKGQISFKLFEPVIKMNPKPKHKFKVEMNQGVGKKTNSTSSYNPSNQTPTQEEIDAILDKISKTGYDRLSKEEKDILFKASQE